MSFIDYLNAHPSFTNLPDLLNCHHSNPLGMSAVAQLIAIFVVVSALAAVNYMIRYRGRSNLYNCMYALYGLSLLMVYYYCFDGTLPQYNLVVGVEDYHPFIGWFCYPKLVGWPWALVNMCLLTFVIFQILAAGMQTVAELSVKAGMSMKDKPWKEWKVAVYILLVGVALIHLTIYVNRLNSSWMFFIVEMALLLFVIAKIVAESMRTRKVWLSFLIGLTALIGTQACLMLSIECLRGALFFFILLVALLTNAKARKKK